MELFATGQLTRELSSSGPRYLEFLRVPSMSCGVYGLPKGGTDPQSPHAEDEVYFVLEGRAQIRVGLDDRPVEPGHVIYVPAHVEHRFHDIVEDLNLLVLFAPAEGSAEARTSGGLRP